jgi:hypothetical protein
MEGSGVGEAHRTIGALDAGNQYYLFIVVDVTTFKPLAKNPECRIINTYLKVVGII